MFPWEINLRRKPAASKAPVFKKEAIEKPNLALLCPEKKSLLIYQRAGVDFLNAHKNSLLADEMGLGKTVQAICFMNTIAQTHRRRAIICPASLVINWQRELYDWDTAYHHAGVPVSTFINSYNQLLLNPIVYENTHFDILIVDEAHYIRNPQSQRAMAIAKMARNAKRVVFLTGTPMPNGRPIEIWPLLQILDPESWDPAGKKYTKKKVGTGYDITEVGAGEGAGFMSYAKRYCDAKKVTYGKKSHWEFNGAKNLDKLSKGLTRTVMLRRTKDEVMPELPAVRRQTIVLQRFDEPIDYEVRAWTGENYNEKLAALRANKVKFDEISAKRAVQATLKTPSVIDYLIESTGEGDKVIVFAHHLAVLREIHAALADRGAVLLTGDDTPKNRQLAVDVFQDDPNCRFFVGSLQASGTGLTLTAADRVVFAELDWSPYVMDQAEARAHRIGQKSSILAQFIVVEDTIDANLARCLLEKKERLADVGLRAREATK